ncbi:MAG TPA: polysaccharide biosynthesis/export family protein [Bacteroidota bacterium]|nr:polysaccharide biosynthesis/export family protein [Bacteroidota bacterium]
MQKLVVVERAAVQIMHTLVLLFAGLFIISCSTREGAVRDNFAGYSRSGSGSLGVAAAQPKTYRIKQGDSVDVSVWGYPEFSTKGIVREGGLIIVPLIGEIMVEGLTKEQFQQLLKQKLSDYIHGDPRIIVAIFSPLGQRVTVIGAVAKQENFQVLAEVPLVEMISSAGGTTPEADLRHVKIIRAGRNEDPTEVDLATALENGTVERLPRVRPGDTVFVPKTENAVKQFSDFLRDAVLLFGFFSFVH